MRLLGAAQKREVKAAQNLSRIVAFFIICWFPLYTINFIVAFCPNCQFSEFFLNFCIILSHVNSAGNPLLYAYHLKDFRAALKNFIHRLLFHRSNDTKNIQQANLVSVIQDNKSKWVLLKKNFYFYFFYQQYINFNIHDKVSILLSDLKIGGSQKREDFGLTHSRSFGSQQQLSNNNSKYPNLLRQVQVTKMREMQAAAISAVTESSICIVK